MTDLLASSLAAGPGFLRLVKREVGTSLRKGGVGIYTERDRLAVEYFKRSVLADAPYCVRLSHMRPSERSFLANWDSCRVLLAWVRALALLGLVGSASAEQLQVPGGSIEIEFVRSSSPVWEDVARKWVETSANAVSGIRKIPGAAHEASYHLFRRHQGRRRNGLWLARAAHYHLTRSRCHHTSLADDWLLTHEMIHLALPSLAERHQWLEEGLATYVEPIARARAGNLTLEQVWHDFIVGLPQGQPQAGDRGLDGTPTGGRTYWGGALFCLRADVTIRQRTGNRFGLEHSLRAIFAAGGSIDRDWTIDRVIEVGDQAVGVSVLRELYEEMRSQPVTVDLELLWRQLGITRQERR